MHRRHSSPRLIGRASELDGLLDALAEVGTAGSAVALVAGEAGAGKTRLVTEFATRARAGGATVLVGGCVRLAGAEPPYIAMAQALDQLRAGPDGLAALFAQAGDGGSGAAFRARLFSGVTGALAAVAESAPVALVLEDAHWADQSTLDLVRYVIHTIGEARVLVVMTYRGDEVDRNPRLRAWLAALRRTARVFAGELVALSDAEVAEQIEGILGAPPPPDLLAAVTARADGNPFHVEELVAAGAQRAGELPPSLRDVLVSRLEALPPRSRHLLRVGAVAGRQVEEPLIRAVLKVGGPALAAAVRPAVAHDLLRPLSDGSGYEFRHELVREAARAELLPGERIAIHAAIATWLVERQPTTDAVELSRIAHHWCGAHDDDRAVPALAAAGAAAMRAGGFEEAYAQLAEAARRWLALGWKPSDEVGPGLNLAEVTRMALHAAALGGAIPDSRRIGDAVLAVLDPEAAPQEYATLAGWLGLHRMLEEDNAGAHEAYTRALALLPDAPTRLRAWVLARYAKVCMLLNDVEPARRHGQAALAMARQLDEPEVEGIALTVLGALADDPAEGIGMVRDGLAIAERYGDIDGIVRGHTNLSHLHGLLGRIQDEFDTAMRGLAEARRLGVAPIRLTGLRLNAIAAMWATGDWSRALDWLDEMLSRALPAAFAPRCRLQAAHIHLARGDFTTAAALLDASASGRDLESAALRSTMAAELAVWQARPADSLAAAERAVGPAAGLVGMFPGYWPVAIGVGAAADLVELSRATRQASGAARAAARALGDVVDRAVRASPRAVDALEAPWRPLVAAEMSRLDTASDPDAWRVAGDAWSGHPWRLAYCRYRLAEALVTRGHTGRGAAASPLVEAWRLAERLGAAPLTAMTERLARQARVALPASPPPPTEAPPADAPPDPARGTGLTGRELEVLRLLAAGHTNAAIAADLYISGKTVDTHVSHVLRKLGVSRRTEAAALAHRLGLHA